MSVFLLALALAGAVQAPPPETVPVETPAPARARRADLGRAYLLLERSVADRELPTDTRRTLNRRVDRVAGMFFANRFADAIEAIAEALADLDGLGPDAKASFVAANLHRASVEPPVVLAAGNPTPTLRLEPLAADRPLPATARIRIVPPEGEPFTVEAATTTVLPLASPRLGRHGIELLAGEGVPAVPIGAFQVVARPPEALAAKLAARLDGIGGAHPQDLAAVRSRLSLLVSSPSPARSAEFLSDQAALAAACERDVAALEAGESPFVGRREEHWRTVSADAVAIPVGVVAGAGEKLPLVIALHGAGGDENMFFSGYGNGLLARLAVERGFVAVTPYTPTFMASPVLFDALVEEMARCYPIDRERIVLLGHSLGAGAAGRVASLRPAVPAAVGLVAGPAPVPTKELAAGEWPPMFAACATLDGVIPAESIRRGVEASRSRGASIELREYPHEGHTLVVGTVLPEVIDFLLAAPPRGAAAATPATP